MNQDLLDLPKRVAINSRSDYKQLTDKSKN